MILDTRGGQIRSGLCLLDDSKCSVSGSTLRRVSERSDDSRVCSYRTGQCFKVLKESASVLKTCLLKWMQASWIKVEVARGAQQCFQKLSRACADTDIPVTSTLLRHVHW